MKSLVIVALLLGILAPHTVQAATADLSIFARNIRFSEEVLYAGDTVRLYATVKNSSETDVSGKVIFYQGAVLIGSSQTVSVLANGGSDDVYVDYVVPKGTFNIRAVIQGQDPSDTDPANDEAITGLFTSVGDIDGDRLADEEDNCPEHANADQADADGDGEGDTCDETIPPPVQQEPEQQTSQEDAGAIPAAPASADAVPQQTPSLPSPPSIPTLPREIPTLPSVIPTLPRILPSSLPTSPFAQFSYRRIDWRTYEFTALTSEGQGQVTYAWDFGDGATSVQSSLVHAFPDAGQYTVTLAVIDEAGNMVSDAEVFDISFFHVHNPWVQATLAGLSFILLGLLWFLVRLGEEHEEKAVAKDSHV